MDKKKKNTDLVTENNLTHWLSSTGFLFPRSEEELDHFNEIYKDHEFKLKDCKIDPEQIISGQLTNTGHILDLKKSIPDNEIQELRLAARKGESSIPDHILKKMQQKHKRSDDDNK